MRNDLMRAVSAEHGYLLSENARATRIPRSTIIPIVNRRQAQYKT
jgi:hypothetical protein